MGINMAVLAYSDDLSRLHLGSVEDDMALTKATVLRLFPRKQYGDRGPVNLMEGGFPERGVLNVGTFEGGELVATRDAHLFNPTKLHRRYVKPATGRTLVLLTQRSSYDMFAYARWEDCELVRSVSVNPVGGVWEDFGTPEEFEAPYWRGDHAVDGAYPLPFHPLDLGGAAMRSVLGLLHEGQPEPAFTSSEDVKLRTYAPILV